MDVGEIIRTARMKKWLTQEEFEKMANEIKCIIDAT